MDAGLFVKAFVTVLVILDPVGNVPVFLALTARHAERRARIAWQATLVAGGVILAFALFGQGILALLGISVAALQVAGGLVLALVALQLLGLAGGGPSSARPEGNPALVPLGTPLLAGPGAIAATMVYMRGASHATEVLMVVGALLGAVAVVYVALRSATVLARWLRPRGIELVTRLVGLLLAAIAVQLVAEGVAQWLRHGVG